MFISSSNTGILCDLHNNNKMIIVVPVCLPPELIVLMRKLHEAFIALAAQLHHVHEAVKVSRTLQSCILWE